MRPGVAAAALVFAYALQATAQVPPRNFSATLLSGPPDSSSAGRLQAFGRLVGSWDVRVAYYPVDRASETLTGDWDFSWILEGQAVQDVFRVPAPAGDPAGPWRGLGTTIRVWDPALGAWRSTWISALTGSVTEFIGREVGAELHLEPSEVPTGERYRWIFFDVGQEAFRWRAESSVDSGRTWRVEQEMWATRREEGDRGP